MVNGCSEALHSSVADAYRSLALAVFGTGARDKMQLAEMSVTASIADISGAEDKSKRELAALVKRVRELDPARNRSQVLDLLARTRVLRASLASMAKKRSGMEQNLETLRQSQLNQNMLMSMKHTNDALQTLGLKVSDADNIMLDLEDTTGDSNALTSTLSSSFVDHALSYDDLEDELALMMSEDALCALPIQKQRPSKVVAETPVSPAAPAQPAAPPEHLPVPEGGSAGDEYEDAAAADAVPDTNATLQQESASTEVLTERLAEGPK